jgi:hypothetical protein
MPYFKCHIHLSLIKAKCGFRFEQTMKDFAIRKTQNKGEGVFALRDFKKGEHIFHVDLTKLERYSVQEINSNQA